MKQRLCMSSKDTWTHFKRREEFEDFCENQNLGIKMQCKTVGTPSQVRMPKIAHTVTHMKQNSLFCCHTFTLEPQLREISPYRNLPSCSFFWSNYLS